MLELFLSFLSIGFFTIGGGYVMVPVLQKEVILKGWLSLSQFKEILAVAGMLPGPIAINTATFVGYKLFGVIGSFIAASGFVIPSFVTIILISNAYESYKNNKYVNRFMAGVMPAITAIILSAVVTFGRSIVDTPIKLIICITILLIILRYKLNLIIILIISGLIGILIF